MTNRYHHADLIEGLSSGFKNRIDSSAALRSESQHDRAILDIFQENRAVAVWR
jgi:hypothetical protein